MEGGPAVGKPLNWNNLLEGSKVSVFDSSSPLKTVYKRRKFQKEPSTCFLNRVTSNESSEERGFVYQRRKPYSCGKSIFPIQVSVNVKPNNQSYAAACSTVLKANNPVLDMEKQAGQEARDESEPARSSISAVVCRDEEPVLARPRTINGSLDDEGVRDERDKIVERHSFDDGCCSSSTVNMITETDTLKPEADECGECSSSGACNEDVIGQYQSERDLCISILRKQGFLSSVEPNRSFDSGEEAASCSAVGPSLSCNICSHPGSAVKMLICDRCEVAYHVSCCSRLTRQIDNDEWFCPSCVGKKHSRMKKATQ